jgi:gamma-carbonic anhydrase
MPITKPFDGVQPTIHPDAFIAENAVIIGDVTIEKDASIWYGCVLRGDVAPIMIGEGSNIQDGTVIHVASAELGGTKTPTLVGKRVTVGHMALLHACTLEDESFVGMQSCVMDGATLKTQAMLGAGSLVPNGKILDSGQLYMGRPAIHKRTLDEKGVTFLAHSAAFYVALSKQHKLP